MRKNDFLLFDVSNYKNDLYNRHFILNKYLVKGKAVESSNLKRFFNPHSKLNKLLKKLNLFVNIYEEGFYVHQNLDSKFRMFTTLRGYWQSDRYFYKIRNQLLQEIVPEQLPPLPAYLNNDETVAVHIRRTDYLQDERYNFLGKAYYDAAIEEIKTRVHKPFFIFFSDDILWCRQNFAASGSLFCEEPEWQSDYLQLYLMAQCKHHIIANSSFSWWGAWLCANPGQIVIRPARPFKDESLLYENYYPEKWIAVEN